MHAFVQHAVVGDDVGSVAGHEQSLEIRIVGKQIAGQLPETLVIPIDFFGGKPLNHLE